MSSGRKACLAQPADQLAGGGAEVHPVPAPVAQARCLADEQEGGGGLSPDEGRWGDREAVVLAPAAGADLVMEQF